MVVVIKKGEASDKIEKKLKKIFDKTIEDRKARFEKLLGVIKLDEDAVVMQRRWRDEWRRYFPYTIQQTQRITLPSSSHKKISRAG